MRSDKENVVVNKTLRFALEIIQFAELLESKRKFVIAKQVLKSGTSIGANVSEAQNAESRADFIHKMKIAAKEADETAYWLNLCELSSSYPNTGNLIESVMDIIRLLSKIISTSKQRN